MRTNKRTVWFLTLLSLVAVISIYYVNKKAPMPFDGIQIFENAPNSAVVKEKTDESDQKPVFAESYLLEEMRMEVRNERSKMNEQLLTKINSADYTAVEKNGAFDEMALLTKRDSAEALMEMQIVALGYPDAFVRTDGNIANVTVLSEDGHSLEQSNEIVHLVMSSWGEAKKVFVDFQGDS